MCTSLGAKTNGEDALGWLAMSSEVSGILLNLEDLCM